ncbi:MAG: mechanosensitive ion channel [Victivallales bacterium]|nr:mechanosensitive ion channel [Victivallales bacterium]
MKTFRFDMKRLAGPAALLVVFVIFGLRTEDVLRQFGLAAVVQGRQIFEYGAQIGLWFSAAFFINRLVAVIFWDGLVARAIKGRVPRLLKDSTAFVIYLVAASGVIQFVFHRPVTGFWATSGAVGVVLGIALRNIILDLFTGLAVNIDRPYSIGDWVMIVDNPGSDENLVGCVQEINWRTTRLRTTSNNMLVVPNNVMGQKVITNFMAPGERSRFEVDFTLDFSVPSERAIRVLSAAALAVADAPQGPLSDPKPKARVTGISDLGVKYRLRYWTVPREVSPARARHTVITSVLAQLHQAGMTLAYPKQDTYYAAMPKRQFEPALLEDRCEILKRIAWFAALATDEVRRLSEAMIPRQVPAGTVMMHQGDTGDSMFVLLEGMMEVFANSPETGGEIKVGKLTGGDVYGEMSLLTGAKRAATVKAATQALAYEIRKEHLAPILEARPEATESISRIVAERRVATEQAMAEAVIEEPEERVQSLAATVLKKIKSFFSLALHGAGHILAPPIPKQST